MGDETPDATMLQFFSQWLTRVESRIDEKFDKLFEKLDGKADKSDIQDLRQRLDAESGRIDSLEKVTEHQSLSSRERKEWRQWVLPLIMTAILAAATVFMAVK